MSIFSIALLTCATVLCGLGWSMIAYSGYASQRGWPIGEFYAEEISLLQGIAYLAMIAALCFGYAAFGWWSVIVLVIRGNIMTRLLLVAARENTQLIAPAGVILLD